MARVAGLLAGVTLWLAAAPAAGELRVVLRYDDYSSISDARLERSLFEAARELDTAVLVGVIPFVGADHPVDGRDAPPAPGLAGTRLALLRQYALTGVVDVAVHGYTHANRAPAGEPMYEFKGLPAATQAQWVKHARDYLERVVGVPVPSFIPPFNAYDRHTLAALQAAGFDLISAGRSGPGDEARLRYLPGTIYPHQLRPAIEAAAARGVPDAIIVVTAHPYDFLDSGSNLPEFRKHVGQITSAQFREDLEWANRQPGVRFVSARDLAHGAEDLSAQRLLANARLSAGTFNGRGLLPGGAQAFESLYYPRAAAEALHWRQWLLAGLLFGALALAAAAALWVALPVLTRRRSRLSVLAALAGPAALGLLLARSASEGFFLSSALLAAVLLGVSGAALARLFVARLAVERE